MSVLLLVGGGSDNLLLTDDEDLLLADTVVDLSATAVHASFHVGTATLARAEIATATAVHASFHLLSASLAVAGAAVATAVHASFHLPAALLVASGLTHSRVRVRVIDLDGAGVGFVRTAEVTMQDDPLNDLAEARIRFSAYDPTAFALLDRVGDDPEADMVGCLRREVQVWRDGVLLFEGPAPRWKVSDNGTCECQAFSFDWWLARRFVGRADRTNLLTDGGFEDDPLNAAWVEDGTVATIETGGAAVGASYVNLTGDGWLRQTATFEHEFPPGLDPRVAVRIRLPDVGSLPVDKLWFTLEASDNPGALSEVKLEPTTVAVGVWQEFVFNLGRSLAPGVPWDVTLSLRGVGGDGIDFDDVRLVQPESVGAPFGGADPADVAVLLVDYMQDPAHGKDDVRIGAVAHPTGQTTDTVWQDSNHESYSRAIRQLTDMVDGIDLWRDWSTRTLHFGPRRGQLRPALPLRLGRSMPRAASTIDGTATATSGVVLGIGSDFTRNEGGYIATTDLPILERVDHAPVSMPLREYDLWAEENVKQASRAVEVVDAETTWGIERVVAGDVETGDTVLTWVEVGGYRLRRWSRIVNLVMAGDEVTPELVPEVVS